MNQPSRRKRTPDDDFPRQMLLLPAGQHHLCVDNERLQLLLIKAFVDGVQEIDLLLGPLVLGNLRPEQREEPVHSVATGALEGNVS